MIQAFSTCLVDKTQDGTPYHRYISTGIFTGELKNRRVSINDVKEIEGDTLRLVIL